MFRFRDMFSIPMISRFGMIQSTVLRGREMESPTMFSIMRAMVESPA